MAQAFVAAYGPREAGTNPEVDDTMMTSPAPRGTIARSAAWVSRRTAVQFSASNRSWSASSVSQKRPLSPMPALLTSTSTGRSGSASRSSTAREASRSVRSAGSTSTATRCRSRSSAATASSRAASRATSTRSLPSAASARANAAPIPTVDPVTSAVGGTASR